MRTRLFAAVFAAFGLGASAADRPGEPRLAWSMPFGGAGAAMAPAFMLALDAPRSAATEFELPTLVRLDLAEAGSSLRLAGLPVWHNAYRLGHDLEPEASAGLPVRRPWYARKWVFWTAGGLAATAAVLSGMDESFSGSDEGCRGDCDGSGGDGTSINGVGPDGVGCVDDTCAVPCEEEDRPEGCVGLAGRVAVAVVLDPERDRWLDAGTGQMGDLVARDVAP